MSPDFFAHARPEERSDIEHAYSPTATCACAWCTRAIDDDDGVIDDAPGRDRLDERCVIRGFGRRELGGCALAPRIHSHRDRVTSPIAPSKETIDE